MNWQTIRGYAFPPFASIGRCLQQVMSQEVEQVILISPVWRTQHCHPLVLQLCIDLPILLPLSADLALNQRQPTTSSQQPSVGWLETVCQRQTTSVSAETREILLEAWRRSITSAYSSAWSQWLAGVVNNPISVSLNAIFRLPGLSKTPKPEDSPKSSFHTSFGEDTNQCPVRCLKCYEVNSN